MKKILLLTTFLLFSVLSVFASSTTSDSTYTSTDNIKKAQIAMATNEYIVTAGDIFTLAYSSGSFSVSVDNTYRVRIANLGIINAKGLTLQEFKNKVESLIINNYPTSGVQFFLANPAQFHVFIKGEVKSAKTVETWALERASTILKNVYTDYSSTRFFTIVSEDGSQKQYDLFKSTREGDFSQDPYLRPGDTIIVPKIDRKVEIKGAVCRPGVYELLPEEELSSLIFEYADGFTPFASKKQIELSRFTGKGNFYETSYYTETDLIADIPLACYDKVFIPSLENIQPVIFVEGAINERFDPKLHMDKSLSADAETVLTPGAVASSPQVSTRLRFDLPTGKNFVSFILENAEMFINSSDLANAYVVRKNLENGEDQYILVNINKILYPSPKDENFKDFTLEENDKIVIPYTQYYVTVTGGVNSAGKYAYQPGKTWTYYVNLAEGFNLDQNLFKVVKITDKDGKKLSKKSEIPPEAVIYASRNSPNGGWLIPLLSTIISFISACIGLWGVLATLGQ